MVCKHTQFAPVTCAAASLMPRVALAAAPVAAQQAAQVVAGLAIVLVLIALAAWAARRLQQVRAHGQNRIHIVAGLAVGVREKLVLVEVDGCRVLLGLCPGRIATLHTFTSDTMPSDGHNFEHMLAAARTSLAKADP